MSDHIYNTPTSNLDKNIETELSINSASNLKFRKTIIMNILGGACLSIMGAALYLEKINSELGTMLVVMVIFYAIMCSSAFGSAYALKANSGPKLQLAMLCMNWLLIGMFVFSIIATSIATWSNSDAMRRMLISLIPGVLMFVLPQLINIHALNQLRRNRKA